MNSGFVLCIALFGAAVSIPSHAATQASVEGLEAVHSRHLDQVYVSPNLGGYRAVLIEPVRVEFRRNWTTHAYNRIPTRAISAEETQRIASLTASRLHTAVAEAFKARGYEIVAAPGPRVLRLTPSVAELVINAPDDPSPGRTWTFTREAGQAKLLLEARDAVSGTPLARVAHQATARQMGRLNLADEVSNRFWFDALFRRFAAHSVAEFEARRNHP